MCWKCYKQHAILSEIVNGREGDRESQRERGAEGVGKSASSIMNKRNWHLEVNMHQAREKTTKTLTHTHTHTKEILVWWTRAAQKSDSIEENWSSKTNRAEEFHNFSCSQVMDGVRFPFRRKESPKICSTKGIQFIPPNRASFNVMSCIAGPTNKRQITLHYYFTIYMYIFFVFVRGDSLSILFWMAKEKD